MCRAIRSANVSAAGFAPTMSMYRVLRPEARMLRKATRMMFRPAIVSSA